VNFGSTQVTSFISDTSTQIVLTTPPGMAGTEDVTVATAYGTSATSSADRFTYVGVPSISSISPSTGAIGGGIQVTINGTNLANLTGVMFGSMAPSRLISQSATQIVVVAPAVIAGTVDVTVVTAGGTSAKVPADQFTYGAGAAPTVTNVTAASGPTGGGTTVTITGTSFAGSTAPVVYFGTSLATVTSFSATQIIAVSPPGTAGTVDITVTAAGGTSATSSADQFTYTPAPQVSAITPGAGPQSGATRVIITGTNLGNATRVAFGAVPASFLIVSSTELVAYSPPGTGTVDVTVTTAGGTSATSSAEQFTYVPAPIVTNISPITGPVAGGTLVMITGSNLANGDIVNSCG
jgi:hypothetical protein